jgi:parallel beta-helix repeat protein
MTPNLRWLLETAAYVPLMGGLLRAVSRIGGGGTQGPAGPPGATGPVGPVGPTGPQGTPGANGSTRSVLDWLTPGQPDGVTDNTAQLQAAINAVQGTHQVLWFPATPQNYITTGLAINSSNTHLVIDGYIFLMANANTVSGSTHIDVIGVQSSANNIIIEGEGTLDGNGMNQSSATGSCIAFFQTGTYTNVLVADLTLKNGKVNGFVASNVTHGRCRNVKFSGGIGSVGFVNSTECWFQNCYAEFPGSDTRASTDFGVGFYGACINGGAVGCTVTGAKSGGLFAWCDSGRPGPNQGIAFVGNVCTGNLAPGIIVGVGGAGVQGKGFTITGNECYGNVRGAIAIYHGSRCVISGNECHENTFDAVTGNPGEIAIGAAASSVTVSGNNITNPQANNVQVNITTAVWSAGTVTVTCAGAHGLTTGHSNNIQIDGCTPAAYNGLVAASITGATTFTFPLATDPTALTTAGTAMPAAYGIHLDGPSNCFISGNYATDERAQKALLACIGGTTGNNVFVGHNAWGGSADGPDMLSYNPQSMQGYSINSKTQTISGSAPWTGNFPLGVYSAGNNTTGFPAQGVGFCWNKPAGEGSVVMTLGNNGAATGGLRVFQVDGTGTVVPGAGSAGDIFRLNGAGSMGTCGAISYHGHQIVIPTTGSIVTIGNDIYYTFINVASTLASLTIVMPPNPLPDQVNLIVFQGPVTALTINANAGQSINGAPTTAAANTSIQFIYIGTTWRALGVTAGAGAGAGIPEAPTDGQTYGRDGLTAAWNPVLPLAGGTMTGPLNYTATGAITSRSAQDRAADTVRVRDFGAVFDGNSHPLSATFATLAAAQAVYPHAVALSDEIDGVAIQSAINHVTTSIDSNFIGGGTVLLPAGRGLVNQPLSILSSNVSLQGQTVGGIQYHPTDAAPLLPSVTTTLRWTGAAQAAGQGPLYFLTMQPGANGRAVYGSSIQGIEFDCNSVVGIGGPRILSCRHGVIDAGTREPAGVPYASASLTAGSQTITVSSTTGISAGDSVVSPSLPDGAQVTAITGGTTFTVNVQANATSTETVTVGGTGILFDVVGGLTDVNDTQFMRVRFAAQNYNGAVGATPPLVIIGGTGTSGSGGTGHYGNTSAMWFERLTGSRTNGVAVVCNNSDHNYHDFTAIQRIAPGTGAMLVLNGTSDANNGSSRYHRFRYVGGGGQPIVMAGTNTGGFTTATHGHAILTIDSDNGGVVPVWGTGASGWASFDTTPTLGMVGTNRPLAISLPDSTAVGGNPRGADAVDLQNDRTAATMVASGDHAIIIGGANNVANTTHAVVLGGSGGTASGLYSAVVGGFGNTAGQQYSVALGGTANSDLRGALVYAAGQVVSGHYTQTYIALLRANSAANASPVRVTADAGAPGAVNTINLTAATEAMAITVRLIAVGAGGNTAYAWYQPLGLLNRVSGVTTYSGGTPVTQSLGTVTGIAVTEAADTANNGYSLTFTPPTGNVAIWRIHAVVYATRVDP